MRTSHALTGATLVATLVLIPSAWAGKRKKPVEMAPEPVVTQPVAPPEVEMWSGWPAPIDHGGLPTGLASVSAQSCNACHIQEYDAWRTSGHATTGSEAFQAHANEVGSPICLGCHQPLTAQRRDLVSFDGGDVNRPVNAPNGAWNGVLESEGITCAACHIREGRVVAAQLLDVAPAAHGQLGWTSAFAQSDGCASCHQLSWAGASEPLYDTWGEWERSGYKKAGVGCVNCHMPAGAGHALLADPARAFTVDVKLTGPTTTRGETIAADIVVTNTGAGHAMPSGSPWSTIELRIALELRGDPPQVHSEHIFVFARTLSEQAPWATTEDSRLGPGASHSEPWTGMLPQNAPSGPWELVVALRERPAGGEANTPFQEHRLPLRVE
jgi:hypothetical protein